MGRLADLRQRPGLRPRAAKRRARQAADRRPGPAAERPGAAHRPGRCGRQLLGGAGAAALAVHARAQRDLRPPVRGVPADVRPGAVRQGAARERGADGQDPHGRLDARDHRPPDHRAGHAHELVRAARRAFRQAVRPRHQRRGDSRHPRLGHQPPRRALLADRGVRGRLPDASADPRRLPVPVGAGRQLPAAAHAARSGRARGAKPAQRDADGRHLLLLRPLPPGRHHAAQLPEVPAALQPPRRRADRPGLDRRAAHAGAGGAALQRVPAAVPPRPGLVVRAADRQPGLGRGAAADVRRRRAGRSHDRPLRGAQAGGVRVQRHRLPRVHPDGLAPARERPLLHPRLPARGVHAGRLRLGREQHDARRAAAPLPAAGTGAGGGREPVRAVDVGDRAVAGTRARGRCRTSPAPRLARSGS